MWYSESQEEGKEQRGLQCSLISHDHVFPDFNYALCLRVQNLPDLKFLAASLLLLSKFISNNSTNKSSVIRGWGENVLAQRG